MKYKILISILLILLFISGCKEDEKLPNRQDLPDKPNLNTETSDYDHKTYEYLPIEFADKPIDDVEYRYVSEETTNVDNQTITRKDYFVTNPSTNNEWDVSIYFPEDYEESDNYPSIIFVPGGVGPKEDSMTSKIPGEQTLSIKLVNEGYLVLIFSAEGRGSSEGEIDYCGYIDQDGLYEMYRFLKEFNINEDNMGIVSYSYGVNMVSGMLGRYQAPFKYYIEWEGPTNRYYSATACTGAKLFKDHLCDDEEFWQEREALRFVPGFNIDYFIISQSDKDHVQPNAMHALEINNLAIEYVDWIRVDGEENEINQEYSLDNFPTYLSKLKSDDLIFDYILELSEK